MRQFNQQRVVMTLVIVTLIVILDGIWLSSASESIYMPVLTLIQGQRPNILSRLPAAILTWFLVALGIQFYVLDLSTNQTELIKNSFWFGLISYGIYNLTTYITMNQYNLKVAAIDTTWGIVLSILVSFFASRIKNYI